MTIEMPFAINTPFAVLSPTLLGGSAIVLWAECDTEAQARAVIASSVPSHGCGAFRVVIRDSEGFAAPYEPGDTFSDDVIALRASDAPFGIMDRYFAAKRLWDADKEAGRARVKAARDAAARRNAEQ